MNFRKIVVLWLFVFSLIFFSYTDLLANSEKGVFYFQPQVDLIKKVNFSRLKRVFTFEVNPISLTYSNGKIFVLFLDGTIRVFNFLKNNWFRLRLPVLFQRAVKIKSYNNKIAVLWDNGRKLSFLENQLFSFTINLSEKYPFILSPGSIIFLDDERFCILDKFSPLLFVFSRKQEYLGAIFLEMKSSDIILSDGVFWKNKFFITCSSLDKVCVFDRNGSYLECYFGPGFEKGKMNFPQVISLIPDLGLFYILDKWNYRIYKFIYPKKYEIFLDYTSERLCSDAVVSFPQYYFWAIFPFEKKVEQYYISPDDYLNSSEKEDEKINVIDTMLSLNIGVPKKIKLLYYKAYLLYKKGEFSQAYTLLKKIFSQKEKLSKSELFFKMYNVYTVLKWRLQNASD